MAENNQLTYSNVRDEQVLTEHLRTTVKNVLAKKAAKATTGSHLSVAKVLQAIRYQYSLTEQEIDHLWSCGYCRNSWEKFQVITRNATNPLPSSLRSHLIVEDSPVAFPDGTISFESCQFGRLELLRKHKRDEFFNIINLMAKRLVQYLRLNVSNDPNETIVLAAFGNVVKTIADRAAGIMATLSFKQVEAISVTDFEHPKFECERTAFIGAKCVCLCDVAHQGQLLQNMASEAQKVFNSNEWIHQVAIIKQIDETDTDLVDHQGLWIEEREQRYTFDEFMTMFPTREKDLRLFEPELSRSEDKQQENNLKSDLLTNYLLDRNAISINKQLHGNRYLFFIDGYQVLPSKIFQPCLPTLKLSSQIERVENYFYKKTAQVLKEAVGDHIDSLCIAYHERRNKSSSKIAKRLADILYQIFGVVVPTVGVGWSTGSIHTVTKQQGAMLSKSRSVLMVDGAFRTGDAMQSLYRSIANVVGPWTTINALTVVGTQSHIRILPDGADKSFSVHSILQFPLLPPIPRLSDCTKQVKESAIGMVSEMPEQGHLSRIREILLQYIATSENSTPDIAKELARKILGVTVENCHLSQIREPLIAHLGPLKGDDSCFADEFAEKLIHEISKYCHSSKISTFHIQDSLLRYLDALEEDEPEFARELARKIVHHVSNHSQFPQLQDSLSTYLDTLGTGEGSFGEVDTLDDEVAAMSCIRVVESSFSTISANAKKRNLNKVLVQLTARPEVISWLKFSLSQKRLKSTHKSHAVLILAALGKFDWLRSSTWVSASRKWFTSAELNGRWWAFPLTFLLLTERCISKVYSDFDPKEGISLLTSARNQLLEAAHASESFHLSPQLTFDEFEFLREYYNVPMIMIEVIDYCLGLLAKEI